MTRAWTDHPATKKTSLSLEAARRGESAYEGQLAAHEIDFPGRPLTIGAMPPHIALMGASGSGKTIFQKGWLRAVLPGPTASGGLRYRGVVYDPKRELYPFLRASGVPAEQIIVTHPFDKRSAAWDLARDFQEPAQIEELAESFIPREDRPGENAFFLNAARIVLQEVIDALRLASGAAGWDLRDLTEVVTDPDHLSKVLSGSGAPGGPRALATFLSSSGSDSRMADSVRATLIAAVRPFQTLGSLWHRASTSFSLDAWHSGSGVLLLGADPRRDATLQRLNSLLFRRASQLVLGRNDENPADLTWFFLDELREAGRLPGLRQLLTEGRSKGARLVLGFQDLDGLVSVYGHEEAHEIVGLCANRVILHLDNPRTRQWASDFFGEDERLRYSYSDSESFLPKNAPTSIGHTAGAQLGSHRLVLPLELHDLPLPSRGRGVTGFYATTHRGRVRSDGHPSADRGEFEIDREWQQALWNLLVPADRQARGLPELLLEDLAAFEPRSPEDQALLPFTRADCERLRIIRQSPLDR